MITVKQILDLKGKGCYSVIPETSVKEALKLMSDKNVGALLVFENSKPVGIFSERDFSRKSVTYGDAALNKLVKDFMSTTVYVIGQEKSIQECMVLMTEQHIRHLPVVDTDDIIGIVSIGDIVNGVINEQSITIQNLENYIYGNT